MTQLTGTRPEPTDRNIAERGAALAGTAFVVCILAGNSLTESVVGTDDSPDGTVADLVSQASSTAARTGMVLELVGLLLLVAFAAGVTASSLRRRATVPGVLVALSATLVVAVKLAAAAPYLAALAAADELPVDVLQALVDLNDAAFVIGWLPFALFVGSVALCLRDQLGAGRVLVASGVLLAVLGLIAGAVGAVSPDHAVPIPFLLGLLWTAGVGLRLAIRR